MSGSFVPETLTMTPARFSGDASVNLIAGFMIGVSLDQVTPPWVNFDLIFSELVRRTCPRHSEPVLRKETQKALKILGQERLLSLKEDDQGMVVACQFIV